MASARAIATRWRSPPESSAGLVVGALGEPDLVEQPRARARGARGGPCRRRSARPRRSRGRSGWPAGGAAGRRSRPARGGGAARRGSRQSSRPSISTRPLVGCSSPPIRFSSVLLPEPDRPVTASISPGATCRVASRSASICPYRRPACSTRTSAPAGALTCATVIAQSRFTVWPARLDHDPQRQRLRRPRSAGKIERVAEVAGEREVLVVVDGYCVLTTVPAEEELVVGGRVRAGLPLSVAVTRDRDLRVDLRRVGRRRRQRRRQRARGGLERLVAATAAAAAAISAPRGSPTTCATRVPSRTSDDSSRGLPAASGAAQSSAAAASAASRRRSTRSSPRSQKPGSAQVDADDLAELLRAARAAGCEQLEVALPRTRRPPRGSARRPTARAAGRRRTRRRSPAC